MCLRYVVRHFLRRRPWPESDGARLSQFREENKEEIDAPQG